MIQCLLNKFGNTYLMLLDRRFFLLLSLSMLIISYEKKMEGVRIAVDFPEEDSLSVEIYHYPILDEEVLAQLDLDTANYGLMQLELSKPLVSYIKINGTTYELYLEPGYDLQLSKDTTNSESILFEGEGAPINNYINHVTALLNSEHLVGYDLETFARKYDS